MGGGDWKNTQGRWPANVILTHHPECIRKGTKKIKGSPTSKSFHAGYDGESSTAFLRGVSHPGNQHSDENGLEEVEDWECHPECPVRILDSQSGELKSGDILPHHVTTESENRAMSGKNYARGPQYFPGSSGGASRFFYCAKASRSERDMGLSKLPERESAATYGDIGAVEGNPRKPNTGHIQRIRNYHPTIKPISLMQYLVRLVCPPHGIVLDPFCGSGTTIVAAMREHVNAVGLEKDEGYAEIARARVEEETRQLKLF